MPEPQEFDIIALDKADGAKIFQLLLAESQGTEVINLRIDFLKHFLSEDDALIAATEIILTGQVCMLVENHLIHIEFVEICIE